MKFPTTLLLSLILLGCNRMQNPAEDFAIGQGSFSVTSESYTGSGRTMKLSECISYNDAMAGKDPDILTLSLSLADSIYNTGSCMPVYKKGDCFILDQGLLGNDNCYPGTLIEGH